MPKLPAVSPKKLVKLLLRLGFEHKHTVGSHQVFKHPDGRRAVIPMHNRDIPKGTLMAILKDIKVTKEELVTLL
ncbi:MAG: type II toxin-antitoxin system HicA family toxin [Patescibacteria group bacterium]